MPKNCVLQFTDLESKNLQQISLFLRWVHEQLVKFDRKNVKTMSELRRTLLNGRSVHETSGSQFLSKASKGES